MGRTKGSKNKAKVSPNPNLKPNRETDPNFFVVCGDMGFHGVQHEWNSAAYQFRFSVIGSQSYFIRAARHRNSYLPVPNPNRKPNRYPNPHIKPLPLDNNIFYILLSNFTLGL